MPGILDNIGSSITDNLGIIEKAIIEVIDMSGREVKEKKAPRVVGGTNRPDASISAGNSLMNKGILADELKGMAGGAVSDRYVETVANKGRRYFTVQFNPASLQLSGHAGGLVQKMNYGGEDRDHDGRDDPHQSASYTRGITSIILSVSLLFDSCDNQTAFLDDKLTLNPTSVGTGIAKAALSETGKKKISIQKEVEGFISALRNRYTRLITFHWGEFNYSGILRSVGVNYTMFNPDGEPVRATVDLSIMCADDELWPNSLAVWQQRYIKAFKSSESLVKASQKAGSLLNF